MERAFRILRARPHGHVAAVLGTMSKLGLAELLSTRAHRKCQPALDRLQERFGLGRVVLVGDRGMLTRARITQELKPRRVEWITSLRSPTIRMLKADDGPLQLSLFDEQDLAEITSPDFPGERLICCRNPLLAAGRARKRQELLEATEKKLAPSRAQI